jgi:hypothetical protein
MSFLVAEKLDGGCPFWFQRSYRQRMPFLFSEELQTKGALSGFRELTDGECPFKIQRSY